MKMRRLDDKADEACSKSPGDYAWLHGRRIAIIMKTFHGTNLCLTDITGAMMFSWQASSDADVIAGRWRAARLRYLLDTASNRKW